MSAMEHVRYLAKTIGPRGSTTQNEALAARYAEEALCRAGLAPVTEPFTSARSAWHPSALFTGLVLTSELLFLLAGRWGAVAGLVLAAAALASMLQELAFRPNLLRKLLPKGQSQNVWVRLEPQGEVRRQVVLMGHLDSHRTPLAFSTDRWVRLFSTLVPAGLASVVVLILLFAAGALLPGAIWRWLSAPFALVVAGVFLLTLQADFSPYTEGANDNATGAGVVLSLATRLQAERLAHTAVWAVLSGCEEVGCYGADAFAAAHRAELGDAVWIAVDSVGGAGADPSYLATETFLLTVKSDPGLAALFERICARRPELNGHPSHMRGAYTEGAIGAKYGLRVLTLIGHRRDGALPEWHRPTDVLDKVDVGLVERTESLLWELVQEIDRGG